MKLFRKRKGHNTESKPNALSKGIQAGYKRIQDGWANWMMRCTQNFSHRTWVVLLILFVLSTSAFSVYLAASAIKGKDGSSITITPIKKPKYSTEKGETVKGTAEILEAEYNRIKRFSTYMDSLARSPSGKILYDSIMMQRPGLMDSVGIVENYYKKLKQEDKWKSR